MQLALGSGLPANPTGPHTSALRVVAASNTRAPHPRLFELRAPAVTAQFPRDRARRALEQCRNRTRATALQLHRHDRTSIFGAQLGVRLGHATPPWRGQCCTSGLNPPGKAKCLNASDPTELHGKKET